MANTRLIRKIKFYLIFSVVIMSLFVSSCSGVSGSPPSLLSSEQRQLFSTMKDIPILFPEDGANKCWTMLWDGNTNVPREVVAITITSIEAFTGWPNDWLYTHRALGETDPIVYKINNHDDFTNDDELLGCAMQRLPQLSALFGDPQFGPIVGTIAVPTPAATLAVISTPVLTLPVIQTQKWQVTYYQMDPATGETAFDASGKPLIDHVLERDTEEEIDSDINWTFNAGYKQKVLYIGDSTTPIGTSAKMEFGNFVPSAQGVTSRSDLYYCFFNPSQQQECFLHIDSSTGSPNAVDAAKKYDQATDIRSFAGGAFKAIATSVPMSNLPDLPDIDATTPFYGIKNPDGSFRYFGEGALLTEQSNLSLTSQGGEIHKFLRDKDTPLETVANVPNWPIPTELQTAEQNGTWDITRPYYQIMYTGQIFANVDDAKKIVNNFVDPNDPANYRGGRIEEMVRGIPTGKAEDVRAWQLAPNLPVGWDANKEYSLDPATNAGYTSSVKAKLAEGIEGYAKFLTNERVIPTYVRDQRVGTLPRGTVDWLLIVSVAATIFLTILWPLLTSLMRLHNKKKPVALSTKPVPPSVELARYYIAIDQAGQQLKTALLVFVNLVRYTIIGGITIYLAIKVYVEVQKGNYLPFIWLSCWILLLILFNRLVERNEAKLRILGFRNHNLEPVAQEQ